MEIVVDDPWTPYAAYIQSCSKDPYSVWLSGRWEEYIRYRGFRYPTPTIQHGVVSLTRAEWLNFVKSQHRNDFNHWLKGPSAQ